MYFRNTGASLMIQVINRALDILELIGKDSEKPKSLSEIANTLGLNAGTSANIIKTMVERRFLEKVGKKGYILGSAAYKLTGSEGYNKELITCGRQELNALTEKINENSELTVLNNDLRIVLLRVYSSHDLQVRAASEKRAYGTASGISIIANLPQAELTKFIDTYGIPAEDEWGAALDRESFIAELEKIKKDGFAIRTTSDNIVGLAVPIFKNERVVAALGVYLPVFRYDTANQKAILNEIIRTGKSINEKLT
jgi:DNA-binding IclR family transcriptional regulator